MSLNESAPSSTVSATTAVATTQWTLAITNTNNGASKNRYVWVQNVASSQYYNQGGGTSATPPTGVDSARQERHRVFPTCSPTARTTSG